MSEPAAPDELPRAKSLFTRWPGLVWAIPLSALILVLGIAVHAFLERGIGITVSFATVSGVKVGNTKVVYQGYEVGHVTGMDVTKGAKRVDVAITIDGRAEPILRTGTVFWLSGVKPEITDLSSIKGIIGGPTIGIAPSYGGQPTHHFQGLTQEPAVLPGTPGTSYALTSDRLGAIKPRTSIRYHGQEVGKVTGTVFEAPNRFRIGIFIDRPYDALVRANTMFWSGGGLQLSLGGGTVGAQGVDPATLLGGGAVNMDDPAAPAPLRSPAGTQFPLYTSRSDAELGPAGPMVDYTMVFPGSGGDLAPGAAVTLIGARVGTVTERALLLAGADGLPATRITVGLDAARLGAAADDQPGAARRPVDAALRRLLLRGFRAELVQHPPLVGGHEVALVRPADPRPAGLIPGVPPQIPTRTGGTDPVQQLNDILGKLNRMPIERIGRNLGAASDRLRALVSSPKLNDSLTHLHDALANVDRISADARPQVGPMLEQLRAAAAQANAAATGARALVVGDAANPDAALPRAIEQLGDAAESMRALADYLGRHPEALIRGKRPGKTKLRKAK